VALIQELIPLGLMHVQEMLDTEVQELAGARHARKTEVLVKKVVSGFRVPPIQIVLRT